MPCYVAPHSYCNHEDTPVENLKCDINRKVIEFESERSNIEGNFKELKKYADKITDMLCRLMNKIESEKINIEINNDIYSWWKTHKNWDEGRKK